jgi:hypothetical protein
MIQRRQNQMKLARRNFLFAAIGAAIGAVFCRPKKLEAVGLDADGTVKTIGELSYRDWEPVKVDRASGTYPLCGTVVWWPTPKYVDAIIPRINGANHAT